MKKLITASLLCLPVLPVLAYADCTAQLQGWAQQLQPGRELAADLAVCKVSPADPAQTLAVLPFKQEHKSTRPEHADTNSAADTASGADDDADDYDTDVLVADSRSNAIIAHLMEKGAYRSAAFLLQPFTIDTARYQLTPTTRAFGVRGETDSSSRVFGGMEVVLSLYVLDGRTLRRVLSRMDLDLRTYESNDDCTGEPGMERHRTVRIGSGGSDGSGSTARHGYADLVVTEKSWSTTMKKTGDSCTLVKGHSTQRRLTFHYDGEQYPLPKDQAFIGD